MNVPDRDAIFSSIEEALQLLACPAPVQLQLFPDFVCVTDEFALDFDNWQSVIIGNFGAELTSEQLGCLKAIDERFTSHSRGGASFTEQFWTDEALRESADWENIREMARRALRAFGWLPRVPINGNVHIGASPQT